MSGDKIFSGSGASSVAVGFSRVTPLRFSYGRRSHRRRIRASPERWWARDARLRGGRADHSQIAHGSRMRFNRVAFRDYPGRQ